MTERISIHALRGEGDIKKHLINNKVSISIHALRGEGDFFNTGKNGRKNISIHALRGEGDDIGEAVLGIVGEFQSTPSVGRATACKVVVIKRIDISIHALRGEGDVIESVAKTINIEFQSTPSVGRATFLHMFPPIRYTDFNPRPPWGGRLSAYVPPY